MQPKTSTFQYYLFSFSNFIAALGGGMILGRGVDVINTPYLKGGSVLAFFVGIVLGLAFLQLLSKKITHQFSRFFSFFSSLTSLVLLAIFLRYSQNGELEGDVATTFFFLLSLRFGFWFYSRVLRASAAAKQQQSVAWVEIGYYAGTILGLIIWTFPGVHLSFSNSLIIDAILQCMAGFIDLWANHLAVTAIESQLKSEPKSDIPLEETFTIKFWAWRLIIALVFLTIGTQAVIFTLMHQVSDNLSPFIMASFYLGVFIAALACKKNKVSLEWTRSLTNVMGYAIIRTVKNGNTKETHSSLLCLITAVCVFLSVCAAYVNINDVTVFFLLFFVTIAAYFYEILALAILDRIGLEERFSNSHNMIIRSYGLMGVGSAVGLWLLSFSGKSLIVLSITLAISFILSFGILWKRHFSISMN